MTVEPSLPSEAHRDDVADDHIRLPGNDLVRHLGELGLMPQLESLVGAPQNVAARRAGADE